MVSTKHPVVDVRGIQMEWVTGSDGKAYFLNPSPAVSLVKGLARQEDMADRLSELLVELYG
jgi:hypothetical protein